MCIYSCTHNFASSAVHAVSASNHMNVLMPVLPHQARGITMKSSSIALLYVPGAALRPEVSLSYQDLPGALTT